MPADFRLEFLAFPSFFTPLLIHGADPGSERRARSSVLLVPNLLLVFMGSLRLGKTSKVMEFTFPWDHHPHEGGHLFLVIFIPESDIKLFFFFLLPESLSDRE